LLNNGKEWLWMEVYVNKQDYYSNPQENNYHAIFDIKNPITDFNFKPFVKN